MSYQGKFSLSDENYYPLYTEQNYPVCDLDLYLDRETLSRVSGSRSRSL